MIGDPDGEALTVALVAGHGTLTLGTTAGLTAAGNHTGVVTLSGSVADLNAALATLTYRGVDFAGDDWVSVTVGDGSRSTSGSVAVHVTSAAAQAAGLKAQVAPRQAAGVLNKGQANALSVKLNPKGNSGDAGQVQAFLSQVQAFLDAGILTQAQAEALTGPGRTILLGDSWRLDPQSGQGPDHGGEVGEHHLRPDGRDRRHVAEGWDGRRAAANRTSLYCRVRPRIDTRTRFCPSP